MIVLPILLIAVLIETMTTAAIAVEPRTVIIHKRTPYFIDIEAPIDQVWFGCDRVHPIRDSSSGMLFYVLDGDTGYEFHYRRVLDVPMCLEDERKYSQMARGAKTVRLIGIHPREELGDPQLSKNARIPRKFTTTRKRVTQVFIRMQAGDRCHSYFPEDCELPGNYWGGTIPEPIPDKSR